MLTPPSQKQTAVFALIIGINEYKHDKYQNLDSATLDANDIKKYLETSLEVPPGNIRLMLDGEATRVAIKQELYDLATDERIKHRDTVLIYYAGHGANPPAPAEWHVGGNKIHCCRFRY